MEVWELKYCRSLAETIQTTIFESLKDDLILKREDVDVIASACKKVVALELANILEKYQTTNNEE